MHIKRIFIITTISIFMFAILWVGQTTLTSAAQLGAGDTAVSDPQPHAITAVLSGTNIVSETLKLTSTHSISNSHNKQLELSYTISISTFGANKATSIAVDQTTGHLFLTIAGTGFAELDANGNLLNNFTIPGPTIDNSGLTIDPNTGNLIFVNGLKATNPEPIIEMSTAGNIISQTTSPVKEGHGLALDSSSGHLFVSDIGSADPNSHVIRELQLQSGDYVQINAFTLPTILDFADAGLDINPATNNLAVTGELGQNPGVIFDVSKDGSTVQQYLDTGLSSGIAGLAFDDDPFRLYVLDRFGNRILVYELVQISDARYGRSVALYEDTLIVGEIAGTPNGIDVAGALYIHERHFGGFNNWGVTKIITASDNTTGLGDSTAFDGNTLIAGAAKANGNANQSGAAYVFERNHGGANNWGEVAKLIAPDGALNDRFGWVVSFDGDTAVVGARWHNNGGFDRGSAYIFERNLGGANNWGFVKEIAASNPANSDVFGMSVAINNDTIFVGASEKDLNGSGSGLVYVFERDEGGADNWGEVKQIAQDSPLLHDHFGSSLATEGNILVVGAPENSTSRPGAAYIFDRNEGGANNWGQVDKIAPSDGHANGRFSSLGLEIQGTNIVVGAHHTDGLVNHSGTAYVYKPDSSNPNQWIETAKLIASDGTSDDEFGINVTIFGETIAVGAYHHDELCSFNSNCNSGAAYIFGEADPTDLVIEKRVSSNTVSPNQPITYTLVYTNNGPGIAFNTLITDIIPPSIKNLSISNSGPIITKTGTTSFTWEVAPLALNESGTITITGIVSPDLTVDTTISNTAVITNSLDITPTNNTDTAVVQVIAPKYVYLPIIIKPAPNPFPIQVGAAIPTEPAEQGAIFYTTTLTMPNTIPTTGQFYLSSQPDQISPIWVDDELAISLNGNELFTHSFAPNCQPVQSDRVTLPRNVIEQLAGESPTFTYRDICGHHVGASAIWLIWVP